MHVLYEIDNYRVIEKDEAEHGIHVQVKQGDLWGTGIWDGKMIVKNLIDELNCLKTELELEKIKRFI